MLLALTIIASRWPTIVINAELNPDESWLLAGALALIHDPVPWRGADNTTSGPLSSYVLIPLILFGLDTGYAGARIASIALLTLSVICWYLTLKSLRGRLVALLLLLPIVAWLCFVAVSDPIRHADFTHYSTELLPITLLSIAVWLLTNFNRAPVAAPAAAGFVAGSVPFAKLQAAPLAVFIWIAMAAYIIVGRNGDRRSIVALILGGALTAVALGLPLLVTHTVEDAWRSYIVSGLSISTETLPLRELVRFMFGFPHLNLAFAALLTVTVANFSAGRVTRGALGKERLLLFGAIGYALLSALAVWKPGNPWGHYLLLLLHPSLLLAAVLSAPTTAATPWSHIQRCISKTAQNSLPLSFVVVLGVACLTGFLALILLGPPRALRIAAWQKERDAVVEVLKSITRADNHIAVWGYMPKYYAMTGKMPSTRDAITQFQVWDGPQRDYYRRRYLADLRQRAPNIYVDASGEGNFSFKFHPRVPIEEFEDLDRFIQENYVLLLNLQRCGTPRTRIFVSRDRLKELRLPDDASRQMPSCIKEEKDLERTLRLLELRDRVQ